VVKDLVAVTAPLTGVASPLQAALRSVAAKVASGDGVDKVLAAAVVVAADPDGAACLFSNSRLWSWSHLFIGTLRLCL